MPEARGLVVAISNEQMMAGERDRARGEDEALQNERVESGLAAYVRRRWETARRAKQPIERRIMRNLRQRNGEYEPDHLQQIKDQGQEPIYMLLTTIKCRSAKAWIRDTLMPAGDRPWTLESAREPELPEEAMEVIEASVWAEAEQAIAMSGEIITPQVLIQEIERARREADKKVKREAADLAEDLENRIEDQLIEGNWQREFGAVISDLVDFPAAVMKGPVLRRRKRMAWENGEPVVREVIVREVERVDPLRAYPEPNITDFDEGYFIELHRMSRSELYDMIGLPGWKEDAIRRILDQADQGGLPSDWATNNIESERQRANDEQASLWEHEGVEALQFWGDVPGRELEDWGLEVEDRQAQYPVEVWLMGSEVLKLQLNPHPLGRKPYGKDSYERVPGSFWGRGVPDLMRDCQRLVNAAARAMVMNMGIASGPQVAVDTDSIPPGESVTSMFPWKIWQLKFDKMSGSARLPIHFFQPNPMTDALMKVYQHFSQQADEQSGIPSYTYGSGHVGGAGRTASGLSMLMNSAAKGIKDAISHVDAGITAPIVRGYVEHNMLFPLDGEDRIMGDVHVVPKGAMSLVSKEQAQMRRAEFLQQTMNPMDAEIMGARGRAALLREVVKTLDMPVDDVIPDDQELEQPPLPEPHQTQQPGEVGIDGSPAGYPADALR